MVTFKNGCSIFAALKPHLTMKWSSANRKSLLQKQSWQFICTLDDQQALRDFSVNQKKKKKEPWIKTCFRSVKYYWMALFFFPGDKIPSRSATSTVSKHNQSFPQTGPGPERQINRWTANHQSHLIQH